MHWHELDIADHMPSEQCVMVLMAKMETLSKTKQVGEKMIIVNFNTDLLNISLFESAATGKSWGHCSVSQSRACQDRLPSILVSHRLSAIYMHTSR